MSFDLTACLGRDEDLLFLADSTVEQAKLLHMTALLQNQVGFVSESVPFLSNLSAIENITLGTMYTQNISLQKAEKRIKPAIAALGLDGFMHMRKESIPQRELAIAMFLRCLASDNRYVFLESPSVLVLSTVFDCRSRVDSRVHFWVSCLMPDREYYRDFDLKPMLPQG
ncbi:MAG: hypothetical protein ACLFNV_04355 [Desulfovibrionales bacterium]